MTDEAKSLTTFLTECVEAAKMADVKLEYLVTESVDTESESTNLTVRFGKESGSHGSLNLLLLLKKLKGDSVVSETDLIAPPDARLVILGAVRRHNYKITIQL